MPVSTKARRQGRALAAGLALALVVAAAGGAASTWSWWGRASREKLAKLPIGPVQRADLEITVRAGGQVESSQRTLIECELEQISIGSNGVSFSTNGQSRILELIPDGTTVKKGDVLAQLESSDYEEMVRQQIIKVDRARADHLAAELDLKAAQMAIHEFEEGTWSNLLKDYRSKIALAEGDLRRQADRVHWAREMAGFGYVASGQATIEEQNRLKAEISLKNLRGEVEALNQYGGPINLQVLKNKLDTAQTNLDYQDLRLDREERRLRKFERQVELCTVRAPHDGFVIYANKQRGNAPNIEVGNPVYQKMPLFYLPDLGQMEIHANLHETVIDQVQKGQAARVRVEGLPRYELEGHVVRIDNMPLPARNPWEGDSVKNYLGRIKLDTIPSGVLPGMTAEVEIVTDQLTNALVIPPGALAVEDGRDVCYVAGPDGLERRPVKLGHVTPSLLEITGGLTEGERVVLDTSRVDEVADLVLEPDPATAE